MAKSAFVHVIPNLPERHAHLPAEAIVVFAPRKPNALLVGYQLLEFRVD
ncbi:MAG: hypothetical protein WCF30_10850 [Terracidiphilus sp.]